jgi:hypothetical protein
MKLKELLTPTRLGPTQQEMIMLLILKLNLLWKAMKSTTRTAQKFYNLRENNNILQIYMNNLDIFCSLLHI